jgi:uncharacterized protein (TIGR00369 family)
MAGSEEPPPVVKTLKLGLLDQWGPGWARKVWQPTPEVLQLDGSMFGGYLAALADQIFAFATLSVIPGDKAFRTINLGLQFHRVARKHSLTIEARVVAQSRQVISLEGQFHDPERRLIATATAQQVVTPMP